MTGPSAERKPRRVTMRQFHHTPRAVPRSVRHTGATGNLRLPSNASAIMVANVGGFDATVGNTPWAPVGRFDGAVT